MKKITLPLMGLVFLCHYLVAQENEMKHENQNHSIHNNHLFSHAPIGVKGDHMHHKGSLMLSYRFMWMNMSGNLSGTNTIDNSDIFSNYMASPQSMTMGMHMLGAMYAPSDKFTIMLMGNYISNSMDLKTKTGTDFQTLSNGFSDLNIIGLIKLINKDKTSIHANIGLSVPTGSIGQRDDTPMEVNAQLAYPMQLGSGTWDPSIGVTYLGRSSIVLWGAQAKYKFRINENSRNYTLGNEFLATAWGTIKASEKLNFSLRANFLNSKSISGADLDLNPMIMPLSNTLNSGKKQLDLLSGVNFYLTEGVLKGTKIGIEAGYPIYQDVLGVQMKQNISIIIGIQYVFGGQNK